VVKPKIEILNNHPNYSLISTSTWVICSRNIHFADTVKKCVRQPAYAIGTFTVKIKQTNSIVQVNMIVHTKWEILVQKLLKSVE
jgi:hypothetical protein